MRETGRTMPLHPWPLEHHIMMVHKDNDGDNDNYFDNDNHGDNDNVNNNIANSENDTDDNMLGGATAFLVP